MKRVLLILSAIVIIAIIVVFFALRSSSGFKSIYFVPDDAVMIFESPDPIKAWDDIVHSEAWGHFSKNEFFSELNSEIQYYDSLINSSKVLFNLVGDKAVTMSQHYLGNNKYDFIYIIDIGNAAKYKSVLNLLQPILSSGYEVTSRDYKGVIIMELFDKEEGENYFMAFSEGNLIFSFEPKLVERAIDASESMNIGKDMSFLKVQSKVRGKGLFNIFINYDNLAQIMKALSPESQKSFNSVAQYLAYSGLLFDIDKDGLLTIEGYTSLKDSVPENYLSMMQGGDNEVKSADVIPLRLASLVKINFDDAREYVFTAMKNTNSKEYDEYVHDLQKFERKFNINMDDNLFGWMKDEIILLQTQPSNLGRSNEFATILHASDSSKAAENIAYLWKQIKKNTPVKIKSVGYRGYHIDYVAFPGLIKALFGKMLGKLEKPYFAQLGDNVIISNHPQTLKNIIDDYLSKNTLSNSTAYSQFMDYFSNNTSTYLYCEPPVLYHNLKGILDPKTWQKAVKNKEYITCFSQGGIQLNRDGDMVHVLTRAKYQGMSKEWAVQHYNPQEMVSMFAMPTPTVSVDMEEELAQVKDSLPDIIISDLDASSLKEYYDDGTLKLEVELKDGLKHGTLKVYHPNGELKLRGKYDKDMPVGKWKYYDEKGDLTKVDRY